MDEKPTKKRGRWPAVVMALVLLFPPAYVLSAGPTWQIAQPDHVEMYVPAYRPLLWLSGHFRPFGGAMAWYCRQWPIGGFGLDWDNDMSDPPPVTNERLS